MSYEARQKELFEALEEQGYAEDREARIRRGLEAYFRHRETLLRSLLDLLKPGNKPNFKTWLDRAMDAVRVVHDRFEKIEPDNEWLAAVGTQEHKFFFVLYRCPAAKHRDRMVEQSIELGKAMKEFENKWNKIKDSDKSIEDKIKKVAEQYEELLVDTAQFAAETEKQAKEKMWSTVQLLVKTGFKGVDLGVVEKILSGAMSAIGIKLNQAKQRKLEIFALLSREEQVFGTFKESREIVEEFLADYGYPKIKAAYADGEEAAERLEKSMVTAGQKSDAAAYGKAIEYELEKVFSAAEKQYREFAKKHEHLFFGPLGSGYIQELMENDFWKTKSSKWKDARHDFDDLLRERTLAASKDQILEVSMSGLEGEDRDRVYYTLKDACAKLARAWNEWKDWNKKDPDWILDSREEMQSILKALR